jgi:hypothetical protein
MRPAVGAFLSRLESLSLDVPGPFSGEHRKYTKNMADDGTTKRGSNLVLFVNNVVAEAPYKKTKNITFDKQS